MLKNKDADGGRGRGRWDGWGYIRLEVYPDARLALLQGPTENSLFGSDCGLERCLWECPQVVTQGLNLLHTSFHFSPSPKGR